ncbi:alcohol dehydrogenase catalytic domain-containing protein [Pseudoroseomonas wenyumeiae]
MNGDTTLPEFSRAAVVRQMGRPVTIECVPVPRGPEPGALMVRTTACSICGTDVHLSRGNLSLAVDLPVILGHEMVGRIVAIGEGAERDSVGQPSLSAIASCGRTRLAAAVTGAPSRASRRSARTAAPTCTRTSRSRPTFSAASRSTATCCRNPAASACPTT